MCVLLENGMSSSNMLDFATRMCAYEVLESKEPSEAALHFWTSWVQWAADGGRGFRV